MRHVPLAAIVLLLVAGCSGREAEPADVRSVTDAYTSAESPYGIPLEKSQAECIARLYLESELSDKALADVKAGKPPAPATDQDREVIADIAGKISTDCL